MPRAGKGRPGRTTPSGGAGSRDRRTERNEKHRSRPGQVDGRSGPVQCGIHRAGRAAATRNPRFLFRLPGSFLLRFAGGLFLGWLFQLPPRITRDEPLAVHRERL